jgi:hypothetical protein
MKTNFIRDLVHAGGTGGLNWHVHAYYSRARWQPTLELIEQFLANVSPGSDHLLLIGGSAGWMMPPSWLSRFKRIDAFDIDPLASWLFGRRHAASLQKQGIEIHHHRLDAIANLAQVLEQNPNACVWFDNVLGQHRYRVRDEARVEREMIGLKNTLQGRHWGSLHDVLSGPISNATSATWPKQLTTWQEKRSAHQSTDAEFKQKLLARVGAKDVWQDHLTGQVFAPETITTWLPWAFKPEYAHWLQAGWVVAD